MITDTKAVINMLMVVLFLTMVITSFNIVDFSYFCGLFLYVLILKK